MKKYRNKCKRFVPPGTSKDLTCGKTGEKNAFIYTSVMEGSCNQHGTLHFEI